MFCSWLWQAEGAPVRVSADYAAGADDLEAGIAGDSGIWLGMNDTT